jgi:hypothetical protein
VEMPLVELQRLVLRAGVVVEKLGAQIPHGIQADAPFWRIPRATKNAIGRPIMRM